jgi:hypothetical protein
MQNFKSQFEYYKSLSTEALQQELNKLDKVLGNKLPPSQTDSEIAWLEVLNEAKHNK